MYVNLHEVELDINMLSFFIEKMIPYNRNADLHFYIDLAGSTRRKERIITVNSTNTEDIARQA